MYRLQIREIVKTIQMSYFTYSEAMSASLKHNINEVVRNIPEIQADYKAKKGILSEGTGCQKAPNYI